MTRIIGHRGGRNLWAENSLSGFRNVTRLGVDVVELDVHLSKDGEIMVIHDPLLERTTNGNGPVAAVTAEALSKLVLTDTVSETIPTLAQVLDIFAPTCLELEIELKMSAFGNPYPGLIDKVATLIDRYGMTDRVFLTCFVPEVLEEVRIKAPRVRRLASVDRRSCELFGGLDRTLQRFLELDCVIAVERSLLDLTLDRCVAAIGRDRLGVWVPNTPKELAYWLERPVGQITTDRPDLGVALRDAAARRVEDRCSNLKA